MVFYDINQYVNPNEFSIIKYHLPIDLAVFGFVEREKDKNGNYIKNRCGRDFLYYALHYFYPNEFSPSTLSPTEIEKRKIFGIPMPALLVWTNLSFLKIPDLFKNKKLSLKINGKNISSFFDFLSSMIFPKHIPFYDAILNIKNEIDASNIVGIDLAVGLNGLLDHVMFVYGYDDANLYIFDTHMTGKIYYTKITPENDRRFIMKLPFSEINNRWNMKWNRVWVVKKI